MGLILAVAVMGGLGLILGGGLAYAARRFYVEIDPRIEAVLEALPGTNCGACGYPGCAGLAAAIVATQAGPDACLPGGSEVAVEVGRVMGFQVAATEPRVAALHCQGGIGLARDRAVYDGLEDCAAAQLIAGGSKACEYGCLGLGSCVRSCPYEAMVMGPDGLPVILEDPCTACGICVDSCPRDILSLIPRNQLVILGCVNRDRGKKVKQACTVGCNGCTLCANPKTTPTEVVRMEGFLPVIDRDNLADWSEMDNAVAKCPSKSFVVRG